MHIILEKIDNRKYYAVMKDKKLLLWTRNLKTAREFVKNA